MNRIQTIYDAGLRSLQAGNVQAAEAALRQVLDLDRRHPGALNVLPIVLISQKRFSEAEGFLVEALKHAPAAATFHNYGTVLLEAGRIADALAQFDSAIAKNARSAEAWFSRGLCLKRLHRLADGLEAVRECLRLDPAHERAFYLKGDILLESVAAADALACFVEALREKPDFAEALYGRGRALLELRKVDEALQCFAAAIRIDPQLAEAHFGRGLALARLRHYEEALPEFERALALAPDFADCLAARGGVAFELKLWPDSVRDWRQALGLDPSLKWLRGSLVHANRQMCDWAGHEKDLEEIFAAVREGFAAIDPFHLLSLSDSRPLQSKAAEIWVRNSMPLCEPVRFAPPENGERIRIGYFSSDFHHHATMFLLGEVLELHDSRRFEISAFSFGPITDDEEQQRLKACTKFIDVSACSDAEVAALARKLRIDIAVDLKGYTREARPRLFAHGPAPVTVNYLGYPGTMGSGHMDYIIADPVLIPPEHRPDYAEKTILLPHCYQPNDSRRPIASQAPERSAHGLPKHGFVFCCFNNSYKILPDTFSIWMDVLHAVENSVLWLYEQNGIASANLRKEAAAKGIAPERLAFARHLPLADHLARLRCADLVLDTSPYNAHTTASDALWAGVPMVTRIGDSFVSRVGASLLTAVGLPDLITRTTREYRDLAVSLAQDPARLLELRARLDANRRTHPLFDAVLYTRHLEQAYEAVHVRRMAGLVPDEIVIVDN